MGVELGGWSFGAQFGDLNNDGSSTCTDQRLRLARPQSQRTGTTFSKVAGGNSTIIADATNWPPWKAAACRAISRSGSGSTTAPASSSTSRSRRRDRHATTAARSRWRISGNRGVLDVVVANQSGPLLLYRNTCRPRTSGSSSSWKAAEATAARSAREVRLFWNGQQQVQEVSGGSGFCAQNQRRLHFGLGKTAGVESVEIRWPSGQRPDDPDAWPSARSTD